MYTETQLTPRWCDTDAAGHINNTAVTQWLEAARMDFIHKNLPEGPSMMVRRLELDYDREMTFYELALIRTGVTAVGTKSLTLRQEIWQKDICRATALVVECYYDKNTRRSANIPDTLRNVYQRCMFSD